MFLFSYRQSCLWYEVVNGLQHVAGVHVVVIGVPIVRVARLHMDQHGLKDTGGNLEERTIK